ncbi:hypothetical protein EJ05DRAFT_507567, partial [Pseudovirgaria hyperparasitica]
MRVSIVSALFLALNASAATIAARKTKPYITINTETDLHWSREYPDNLNPVVEYYYGVTSINVTCWVETTMKDDKGIENGNPVYLGVANATTSLSAYIAEDFVQGGDHDFQDELEECPAITHAAGSVEEQYWITVNNPDGTTEWYFPCYEQPSTKAAFKKDYDVIYPEIQCYQTGGEAVNGNTTWVYGLRTRCFLPGGWFSSVEYHGEAPL